MRAIPLDIRALHLRLADADVRAVSREDLDAFLVGQRADVRTSEQFRAAERDAVYDARDRRDGEGGDTW